MHYFDLIFSFVYIFIHFSRCVQMWIGRCFTYRSGWTLNRIPCSFCVRVLFFAFSAVDFFIISMWLCLWVFLCALRARFSLFVIKATSSHISVSRIFSNTHAEHSAVRLWIDKKKTKKPKQKRTKLHWIDVLKLVETLSLAHFRSNQ